jgi:hypothetical protein
MYTKLQGYRPAQPGFYRVIAVKKSDIPFWVRSVLGTFLCGGTASILAGVDFSNWVLVVIAH